MRWGEAAVEVPPLAQVAVAGLRPPRRMRQSAGLAARLVPRRRRPRVRPLGSFKLTYYWLTLEDEFSGGQKHTAL